MTEEPLRGIVLTRLQKDTRPEDEWSALVLAVLEGPDKLEAYLGESARPGPASPARGGSAAPGPRPRIAFLRSITAEGFRGIGQKATLDLTPGPSLTLVVGRNGSGRSSSAEGLELLLTGDTYRWAHRAKVWREGWRNLPHKSAAIEAKFVLARGSSKKYTEF